MWNILKRILRNKRYRDLSTGFHRVCASLGSYTRELFCEKQIANMIKTFSQVALLLGEKGEVENNSPSLSSWFLFLLSLNILDILVTNPAYEANPFTLYLWGKIGIFLSATIKIGLVLSFGLLYVLTKKFAKPTEWSFAKNIFRGMLVFLVAFYIFVVSWNLVLLALLPFR